MKKLKFAQVAFFVVGFWCAGFLGYALSKGQIGVSELVDAFLMGASGILCVSLGLIEKQSALIHDVLAMNRDLLTRNRYMTDVNAAMHAAIDGAKMPSNDAPMGRMH